MKEKKEPSLWKAGEKTLLVVEMCEGLRKKSLLSKSQELKGGQTSSSNFNQS